MILILAYFCTVVGIVALVAITYRQQEIAILAIKALSQLNNQELTDELQEADKN